VASEPSANVTRGEATPDGARAVEKTVSRDTQVNTARSTMSQNRRPDMDDAYAGDAAPFPNLFDDGWTISIFGPDIAFIISSFLA
jgi:hypothetical protein